MLVVSILSLEEPSFWGTVPSEAAVERLIEFCVLAVQCCREKTHLAFKGNKRVANKRLFCCVS